MKVAVKASSTFQRLSRVERAPATASERCSPYTPSPLRTPPRPVSQAERVTSSVPSRSMAVASAAVR